MFKELNKKVLGLTLFNVSLIFLTLSSKAASAENVILKLSPEQCVALTQGQKCYVDATLNWQLPKEGNYCLYSSQHTKAISCWRQKKSGQHNQEFASDKNIKFTLRVEGSEKAIASKQLKVTWVHQKKGQPRMWWRIF